jgi:RimJ/RimL family protein N-acetyltransferase
VRLRRFNAGDLANLSALESDAEVMKFTSLRVPLSIEQSETRLQNMIANEAKLAPLGIWAAELREGGEFVGWFMLAPTTLDVPELGFMIVRKFWGQGLTAEVCKGLLSFAERDLKITRVAAVTDPENVASMRVLQKVGFRAAGPIQRFNAYQGIEISLNLFSFDAAAGWPRS